MDPIKLSLIDFGKYDSWRVLEESYEEEEFLCVPAVRNKNGQIAIENGEVWCLSKVIFHNGMQFTGSSMSRGDCREMPLLWTVYYKDKSLHLFVPPAPDFVLELDGPDSFCKEFNLHRSSVFPLTVEIIPQFEHEPHVRKVLIFEDGTLTT